MTKGNEIFRIRTILPVGLGIAIGLALGAAALANAPAASQPVPATAKPAAVKSLSAAAGIRFTRQAKAGGVSCFTAAKAQQAEMVCAE